jgi:SAM-dependent methyltransferase
LHSDSLSPSDSLAEALRSPGFAQELPGWFYRAIAPSASCTILELGEASVGNWFPNVVRRSLRPIERQLPEPDQFDIVVIHHSLGGCATLREALLAGAHALRRGGLLAMTGNNRLRRPARADRSSAAGPRATGWGFRTSMIRAGFADVALYCALPTARIPVYVIDTRARSARAFFGTQLARQASSMSVSRRILHGALIATNLMPYIQREFMVVGRKC